MEPFGLDINFGIYHRNAFEDRRKTESTRNIKSVFGRSFYASLYTDIASILYVRDSGSQVSHDSQNGMYIYNKESFLIAFVINF